MPCTNFTFRVMNTFPPIYKNDEFETFLLNKLLNAKNVLFEGSNLMKPENHQKLWKGIIDHKVKLQEFLEDIKKLAEEKYSNYIQKFPEYRDILENILMNKPDLYIHYKKSMLDKHPDKLTPPPNWSEVMKRHIRILVYF